MATTGNPEELLADEYDPEADPLGIPDEALTGPPALTAEQDAEIDAETHGLEADDGDA
jgi:hypothetical protein